MRVDSNIDAPRPAPMAEPISVPSRGMGMKTVPRMAPVIAPVIDPIRPRLPAPAFLAPPAPPKNSNSSPSRASIVMAAKV